MFQYDEDDGFSQLCTVERQRDLRNFLLRIEGRSAVPDPESRRITNDEWLLINQQYYQRCTPQDGFSLRPAPRHKPLRAYLLTITCSPTAPVSTEEFVKLYNQLKKSTMVEFHESVYGVELTKAGVPHIHIACTTPKNLTKNLLMKACRIVKKCGFIDIKPQSSFEDCEKAYADMCEYALKEQM